MIRPKTIGSILQIHVNSACDLDRRFSIQATISTYFDSKKKDILSTSFRVTSRTWFEQKNQHFLLREVKNKNDSMVELFRSDSLVLEHIFLHRVLSCGKQITLSLWPNDGDIFRHRQSHHLHIHRPAVPCLQATEPSIWRKADICCERNSCSCSKVSSFASKGTETLGGENFHASTAASSAAYL